MVVTDDDVVVGTAPFYVVRTKFGFYEYNLACSPCSRTGAALCTRACGEIAAEVGRALAHADPVPDTVFLDSLPQGSPLPALLAQGWPRPHPQVVSPHSFPWSHVHLDDGGFEGWLQGRSAKFRQHFRYDYRKAQAAGFEHKTSVDARDIAERLPDFRRLYEARRAGRDGAGPPFDDRFMAVVAEASDELSGTGRLRLATIEKPGQVIAADLIVSAGGHASLWYTGFDDAWAHLSPNSLCTVLSIEHAAQAGDTVYDLGSGAYAYKARLTSDAPIFESSLLVRRGLLPFHTPAQLLPFDTRQSVARALGRIRNLPRSVVGKVGRASSPET